MWPAHARILPLEPTGILQMGSLPGQFRMTLAGRPGGALFRGPSSTVTGCGRARDLGLFQQQGSLSGPCQEAGPHSLPFPFTRQVVRASAVSIPQGPPFEGPTVCL